MSVNFCWETVRSSPRTFAHGTSSDIQALKDIAPDGVISTDDIKMLRAMHSAKGQKDSLWNDIADRLEGLLGDDYDQKISIRVWTAF